MRETIKNVLLSDKYFVKNIEIKVVLTSISNS